MREPTVAWNDRADVPSARARASENASPPALAGDDRENLGKGTRVHDMPRLDPSSPRCHDAQLHLRTEQVRPMRVAVDRDGDARRNRAPRQRAVHVEMRRRPVHLEEGSGFNGGLEQPIVIEIVSLLMRNHAVGRMRNERDQRMLHGAEVAAEQLIARMAYALVERREHEVEPLEDRVRKIEPAVGKDVDLATVENRDAWMLLAQGGNPVALPVDAVVRQ